MGLRQLLWRRDKGVRFTRRESAIAIVTQLISADSLRRFLDDASAFCTWMEGFDPTTCQPQEIAAALDGLTEATLGRNHRAERPEFRRFKPNEEWQRNQRKAARLSINGYRTGLLPNDDGMAYVLCSLAYDLCDFYEQLRNINVDRAAKYLEGVGWDYTRLRIRACREMLLSDTHPLVDPFQRLTLRGRRLRFVSWRTSSSTHASESPENVRGATTLCGGKQAFHRHTHQQWTCYYCRNCRRVLNGQTRDAFAGPR